MESADAVIDSLPEMLAELDVGEKVRVHYETGLPEQSCFQPEETTLEREECGRWHYVSMFGDPFWFTDEQLIKEIERMPIVKRVEVPADE